MSRLHPSSSVCWIELAASPRWSRADVNVQPMNRGNIGPCYGVTVDKRWLCGNTGAVTCFQSMAAALRFLNLLNIEHYMVVTDAVSRLHSDDFQCFQLQSNGLSPCSACSDGHKALALAQREYVREDGRW